MKAIFTILLTVFTLDFFAQTGQLNIFVHDKVTKQPLTYFKIKIYRTDTLVGTYNSDTASEYRVKDLPPGKTYKVLIMKNNYKVEAVNDIRVQNEKTAYITYNLTPKNYKEHDVSLYTVGDSLGNMWTISSDYNHKDFLGRKQGKWQQLFMDYNDKTSGYSIGQLILEGSYLNNNKNSEWIYYKPDGTIKKKEMYHKGKLINQK
jgi:hypothetical protein